MAVNPNTQNPFQPAKTAAPTPVAPAAATTSFPGTLTLQQALDYAKNPKTVPGGGDYNTAQIANYGKIFDTLKQGVKDGQLSLVDFQGIADPLAKAAQSSAMAIGGQGQKAASAVNPVWMDIINKGFITPDGGKASTTLGFNKQEYAQLPNNVLPTQDDINRGMFDPTNAPLQRVQPAPTPQFNPGPNPGNPANGNTAGNTPTTAPASSTPNSQVNGAPVYSANPNDPSPTGGLTSSNSSGSYDAQRIADEAALQQQLSVQSQQGVTAQRQKYLSDLTSLINENTNKQMSEATPGILEDLNTRGLLRSSDVGNQLAIKAKSLNADAANQVAQYGVQGETTDLGNDTNIQNTYNAGRNSALAREFSVEDYAKQVQAGKDLGSQYAALKPDAPSTKQQTTKAAIPAAASIATTAMTK